MSIIVEAVYENGVFKPDQPVRLEEHTRVQIRIEEADVTEDPLESVIGIGEGPADGARNHDQHLYGRPRT